MIQQYAPIIATTIPGFLNNGIVTIPYTHNDFVDFNEVAGFQLIIKNYNSAKILYETAQPSQNFTDNSIIFEIGEVCQVGNYYKFQIAYVDKEKNISKFSYASIGRCVGSAGQITIQSDTYYQNLSASLNASFASDEFIYQYQFLIYDKENNLVEDSGEQLCKGGLAANIIYNPKKEVKDGYKIHLIVITSNKFEMIDEITVNITELTGDIKGLFQIVDKIKYSYDNGFVYVIFNNTDSIVLDLDDEGNPIPEHYIIERSSDKDGCVQLLKHTQRENAEPNTIYFELNDFSIEHGVKYKYTIRSERSKRVGAEIIPHFEDIFLTDGKQQLKISLNPQVSSLKDTILEQKTDTIGGKYPFFFRNGQVKYKEIPISGLISYHMDDEKRFMDIEELDITTEEEDKKTFAATTNLTDDNVTAERIFKQKVMDWLSDGQPKLFRSPTEGNYVIRLMGVSLSPNPQIGRLLHTFQATGYEIADNQYNDLIQTKVVSTMADNKTLIDTNLYPKAQIVKTFPSTGRLMVDYNDVLR